MLLYLLVTCNRTQMTDNTAPGAPDRHACQKRQGLTGAACAGASRSATDHDEPEACGRLQSLVSYVVRELSMEDAGVDAHAVASGLQQHQISFEQLVDKSSAPVTSCATTLSELLLPHAPAGSSMPDLSFAVRIHVDGWVRDNQRDGPAGSKRQPSPGLDDAIASKKAAAQRMEVVLAYPWVQKQCAAVREYICDGEVRERDFEHTQSGTLRWSGSRHELWVSCTCNPTRLMRAASLPSHVMAAHGEQFLQRCGQAEVEAAKMTLRTAGEMLAQLQLRALDDAQVRDAVEQARDLQEKLADLRATFGRTEQELSEQSGAAHYFESQLTSATQQINRLVAERDRRGWRTLCSTAELHQVLHESGEFEKPLNRTLDELHYGALTRISLGDDAVKGGQVMHLGKTARALAYKLASKMTAPAYRLLRAVYRWLPQRKKIMTQLTNEAFVAVGCHQPEWSQQACRIFDGIGYAAKTEPFGLCLDAVKVVGKLVWDEKAQRWLGQLNFDSTLGFSSWADMDSFLNSETAAGYALVFLLCALNPALPSKYVPVGIIPTDLTYVAGDLDRYVSEIRTGLTAAGFGHVIPTVAADNAAVHAKYFKLCGNVRGTNREPGGSLGQELLEGPDAILTQGAYKPIGASCEMITTVRAAATLSTSIRAFLNALPFCAQTDPTHDFKNGSLQPSLLTRLLTCGNFVMLQMMFVVVQQAAGMTAAAVNNADPMDVANAEERLNVSTREALAEDPSHFALLVFVWATACARASWMDRAPTTTPRMRIGWACNNLVFMRWWLDWIEVTNCDATNFISMETHASHVIQDQALILLVLLWGGYFPTKSFPPWLIGSDQCEHFFSECRAMRINQPDWKFADLLRIVQRFITSIKLSSDDDVHLPEVFSNKGYSGSKYTPSVDGQHVHTDWPKAAEVRSEYAAAVERLRPVFVLLGCAEALQRAGRWHGPSLEEWESIERALDLEEAEQAEAAALRRKRRRPAAEAGSDSEEEDGDDGGGGEVPELEEEDAGDDAGDDYFPEEIIDHRVGKGGPRQMVEGRTFLIKWRGYSRSKDDLTWEKQSELIADGNGLLVHRYLQAHTSLKRPEALDAAVQAELLELGEAGGEASGDDGGDGAGSSAPPQRQPDVEPADRAAVLAMLTALIGSEVPNLRSAKALKPNASARQRQAYEATHVTNPSTGQVVHKQAALALAQNTASDTTPGAGRTRYIRKAYQPCLGEDVDGTGFAHGECYELHVDQADRALNSTSELVLEGALRVGYALVMELRKLNGKSRVLRETVRATDASHCSAVVLSLVQQGGRWVVDCTRARPVLVPVLSLGRRVVATAGTGAQAGSFSIVLATVAAGGPQLRAATLREELFAASEMLVVSVALMDMKVPELKQELGERGEPVSGTKAWLRRRLHAAIVRGHLDSADDDWV